MKNEVKRISDYGFRTLAERLLLLQFDEELCDMLQSRGFSALRETCFAVGYCYVDHTEGLTVECLAGVLPGEELLELVGCPESSLKLRVEGIRECPVWFLPKEEEDRFRKQLEEIDDWYQCSSGVEMTREIKVLDPVRHPQYPDDVQVLLTGADGNHEVCWVRLEGVDEKDLIGMLLNQPALETPAYEGCLLRFRLYETEDGIVPAAVAVIDAESGSEIQIFGED